ncbi:hypothetical protein HWV62_28130 [Athelia sp. TMB]|nr:hypothetical protein HWV62_28130 [Athelia sp. TMB]
MAMYSYNSPAGMDRFASPTANGWKRQSLRNIGDVPIAVGNLLVATKDLESALRNWSAGRASENEVSDTYVVVGTEFNNMITAFAQHGIDLSEIHSVPTDLRTVLESCLGEEPSPYILEDYMPDVRTIVWNLLRCLKMKREAWRGVVNGGRGYH